MTQAAGTASSMGVTRTLAANLTVKAATRFPGMPAGLDKAAGTQPAPGPESLSGHRFRASSTFTVTAATMLAHWPVASGRPQGPYRDSRDYSLDCSSAGRAAVSFQGKAAVPAQSASDRIQRHRKNVCVLPDWRLFEDCCIL